MDFNIDSVSMQWTSMDYPMQELYLLSMHVQHLPSSLHPRWSCKHQLKSGF